MIFSDRQTLCSMLLVILAPLVLAADHQSHQAQTVREGHSGHYAPPDLKTLGGTFTLTDQSGRKVTEKDFLGRYALFYFGYSQCDMVCPTALVSMVRAIDNLGGNAKQVVPVFVDFDNSRLDPLKPRGAFEYGQNTTAATAHTAHGEPSHSHAATPMSREEFASFVRAVHPRLVGLIGTRAQTNDMTRKFKVRRQHNRAASPEQEALGYRIDHTTHMYLVGPEGKVVEVFSYGESAERMTERMQQRLVARQAGF